MLPTARHHHFRWYYAWVLENQGAGDVPRSFVSVGSGTCVKERTKDFVSISCTGRKFGHGKISNFSMAPDASSADMRFKDRGFMNTVHWTAKRPNPGMYGAEEGCIDAQGNEGHGLGGGFYRPSRASGRIFGQRVNVKKAGFWTELSVGAMASQCSWADRSLTDDGRAKLTVEFPR